jgi:hypothetical protein
VHAIAKAKGIAQSEVNRARDRFTNDTVIGLLEHSR